MGSHPSQGTPRLYISWMSHYCSCDILLTQEWLSGILLLRYCNAEVATGTRSWKVPSLGHVAVLVTLDDGSDGAQCTSLKMALLMHLCLEELEGFGLEELEVAGGESD